MKVVEQFIEHGCVDSQLICTNIAHVPKKRKPQVMTDLIPITLYNVIYKVIFKVLENRLKKIIDSIILDRQSALNIMIARGLMHFM